jgi:hypothetical protein
MAQQAKCQVGPDAEYEGRSVESREISADPYREYRVDYPIEDSAAERQEQRRHHRESPAPPQADPREGKHD